MRAAALLFLLGCSRPTVVTADKATTPPSASAAPTPDETARWACKVDGDCMMSCAYGAIAREWAKGHVFQECEDGCASKGIEARCDTGVCTAYRSGARYEGCSHLAPDAPKKGE